ncbi:MAG: hemolysin family protein [Acidimicrobiales bacterium]|nr:hemolysin family protein [Acidimicrobiales bacterium]
MTGGLLLGLVTVALVTVFAALVAAAETALTRISRARAESLAAEHPEGRSALADLLADREATLAPLLLLRVVFHLIAAAVVTVIVLDRVGPAWVALAVAAEVIVLYVFAEAMPRTWALQNPDVAARRAAPIVRVVLVIAPLRWASRLLNGVSNVLLPGPARPPVITEDELIALTGAAAAGAAIEDEERELIESVFALGDTIVREVMVPRPDMITADASSTITEVLDLAIEKGLSRLPVCGTGVDDIVGVCLVKDLTRSERAGKGDRPARSLMRRARFVPETKHADVLLREMQSGRHHLAVVVDEYGGTAGLVTLEDVVEELVGEIVDEYDVEEPLLEPLAGGEALVHGRMPVDQLNALVASQIEEGDWDTVGGLIFNTLGHVPAVGESIEEGGVRLRVERMEGRRITRVRLTPVEQEVPADG